jgi:hypothetical protein
MKEYSLIIDQSILVNDGFYGVFGRRELTVNCLVEEIICIGI